MFHSLSDSNLMNLKNIFVYDIYFVEYEQLSV